MHVHLLALFASSLPLVLDVSSALSRSSREEALKHLLSQGRAKLVASTLGAEGCVVITRYTAPYFLLSVWAADVRDNPLI